MSSIQGRYRIGIDTGGTFTDIVAVDRESGALAVTKVPSTPDDPSRGLAAGASAILDQVGVGPDAVSALCHGTTVATNALLEERFSSLGLIVTQGFRHVLEIARQSVPEGYGNSYFWVKPDRIVPLELVQEVDERRDFRGGEIRPLNEDSVRAAGKFFRDRGIEAVGVCLIHAYANGVHERRVREILTEVYPELTVSLSHEVLPEYREYERTVTTLVDAYVKPVMARYMQRVRDNLAPGLRAKPFLVMKSNGGVISAEQVTARPIATALSGPAAGALGAAAVASLAGFRDVVTVDAGGTSTDVCLIENAEPHLTTTGAVGRFPVKLPMIDIVTVGTGGGSIAWRDPAGALKVGPRSAGAAPGPMCYPDGGDEPTITDANVVLGRIPPALIGGGIVLDRERARAGLAALGEGLGLGPEALAAGILEIANWSQANAIRQITIKRGIDPRSFALLSFGGSGPAQSAAVMDLLGMQATLVPPNPGNLSAFGLLAVDWVTDHIRTRVLREEDVVGGAVGNNGAGGAAGDNGASGAASDNGASGAADDNGASGTAGDNGASGIDGASDHGGTGADEIEAIFRELEAEAQAVLDRDGVARERQVLIRYADLRYAGQAWEVRVEAPAPAVQPGDSDSGGSSGSDGSGGSGGSDGSGGISGDGETSGDGSGDGDADDAARAMVSEIIHRFHRAYERTYGYHYEGQQPVELVNFAVSGVGRIERPALRPQVAEGGTAGDARTGERPVWFAGDGPGVGATSDASDAGFRDTPVYARARLAAGVRLIGPAIVEEFGSTTVVFPGQTLEVDPHGVLIIRPAPAAESEEVTP